MAIAVDNRHAMAHRETDLDRITTLLGQCLGRIDEQAFRLQKGADDDYDTADVLEQEAAQLQELVGSLLSAEGNTTVAHLNRIVERAVHDCVGELQHPVVIRERLQPDLPPIACQPGQLAYAVQRAVMIGLSHTAAGDELVVTTRREGDQAVFELESHGHQRDRHLPERAASLMEFVAAFGGTCRIADDRGALLLALELPSELAIDGA